MVQKSSKVDPERKAIWNLIWDRFFVQKLDAGAKAAEDEIKQNVGTVAELAKTTFYNSIEVAQSVS